jgi:glycosyltransferase involved in cell wall biosynthesis
MDLDLIIPTFNRAQLLKKTLESVLRANSVNGLKVTVVVVDNNSSDNTKETVTTFITRTEVVGTAPSVRYLFVARPGKSAALNESLAQTHAEFVGLIDDDEELDPAWFQVLYREFSADPELEYIGGPYLPNWERAPPGWLPQSYNGIIGIVARPDRVAFSPQFSGMLMGGNTVIRRSTLRKVLPYPEHLGKIGPKIRSGEDEVIYHRLLNLQAKGMVVPDLAIHHWIPAERLTRQYFRKWIIGRGISMGSQLRERGHTGPALLGIPRYMFGASIRGLAAMFTAPSAQDRFTAQLSVLDCCATLYGRYFY